MASYDAGLSTAVLIHQLPDTLADKAIDILAGNKVISRSSILHYENIKTSHVGLRMNLDSMDSLEKAVRFGEVTIFNTAYKIYPLVTDLTVHGAREYIQNDELQKLVQCLGRVLITYTESYPHSTDNYRVTIDYPEIPEDVQEFIRSISKDGFKFPISFFCRFCRSHGHTRSQCRKETGHLLDSVLDFGNRSKGQIFTTNSSEKFDILASSHPPSTKNTLENKSSLDITTIDKEQLADIIQRVKNAGREKSLQVVRTSSNEGNSSQVTELQSTQEKQNCNPKFQRKNSTQAIKETTVKNPVTRERKTVNDGNHISNDCTLSPSSSSREYNEKCFEPKKTLSRNLKDPNLSRTISQEPILRTKCDSDSPFESKALSKYKIPKKAKSGIKKRFPQIKDDKMKRVHPDSGLPDNTLKPVTTQYFNEASDEDLNQMKGVKYQSQNESSPKDCTPSPSSSSCEYNDNSFQPKKTLSRNSKDTNISRTISQEPILRTRCSSDSPFESKALSKYKIPKKAQSGINKSSAKRNLDSPINVNGAKRKKLQQIKNQKLKRLHPDSGFSDNTLLVTAQDEASDEDLNQMKGVKNQSQNEASPKGKGETTNWIPMVDLVSDSSSKTRNSARVITQTGSMGSRVGEKKNDARHLGNLKLKHPKGIGTASTSETTNIRRKSTHPITSEIMNNIIENSSGELSPSALRTFFVQVTNRKKPLDIARNFSKNVHLIIRQLKCIVTEYYNGQDRESKADGEIRWIKNLIKRMETEMNTKSQANRSVIEISRNEGLKIIIGDTGDSS